jgi:hypothetical protein
MGEPGGWRWWLRWDCRAIADTESFDGGINVTLCRRWRWHRGECRG